LVVIGDRMMIVMIEMDDQRDDRGGYLS
jgi:hypothetical protein